MRPRYLCYSGLVAAIPSGNISQYHVAMKRRWFIRMIFMLPILLCVGGWAWSMNHRWAFRYGLNDRATGCAVRWGVLTVFSDTFDVGPPGLQYVVSMPESFYLWPREMEADDPMVHDVLGFGVMYMDFPTHRLCSVSTPLWFFVVVLSAVLLFVWRKTGKPKPGRAFPVEMAAKGKEA